MGEFFDAETGGPARLELLSVDGHDFHVLRRLGYRSDRHDEVFEYPADLESFRTDMASVPTVFGWLVPRSGAFLPAAVLHDAITEPTSYTGPRVDRTEADAIFRTAMGELGTGVIRRWLMWAAVTMVTMWYAETGRFWRRIALVGTIVVITILGLLATADLVDLITWVPWMGEGPWWVELVSGAVGAILIPAALSLTWGRHALAGLITGWALAFLIHVTIAVSLVYALYHVIERIVSGPHDRRGVHPRCRTTD
ncbi:DUF1353 domain-containing protein [Microlunatus sp. Y2014]|uniref:DUF1353 domain-containing protein n=1 Tax=Microlunatus sp. Y2014 TaxID=3418488 RepID=UPI003DA71B68